MTRTPVGRRDRRLDPRTTSDPGPHGAIPELVQLLGGESDRSRRFLGGIAAGALVGAAMAGAALMRRRSPGDRNRG